MHSRFGNVQPWHDETASGNASVLALKSMKSYSTFGRPIL